MNKKMKKESPNNPSKGNQLDRWFGDLKINGYIIIEDLAPVSQIEKINLELAPFFKKTPNCEGLFYGYKTRRISSIFSKSKASRELATNPIILGLMQKILGPFCDTFQINLTQGIRIFPGEQEQVSHKDDELYPWPHPGTDFMVNALWALDHFTPENGGTRIWPKSNLFPMTRDPDYNRVVKTEMDAGDVLLYLGSTLHCGGENKTATPRTGLAISYNLGWLRQAENQFLAYPPQIAKSFSKKLRELIGYSVHRPNIGWVEGQDPNVLFQERTDNLPAVDLLTDDLNQMLEDHYAK